MRSSKEKNFEIYPNFDLGGGGGGGGGGGEGEGLRGKFW